MAANADDALLVFADGVPILNNSDFRVSSTVQIPDTCVLAIEAENFQGPRGILASSANARVISDVTWRCNVSDEPNWLDASFNDSTWPLPQVTGAHGDDPWGFFEEIHPDAVWIWSSSVGPGFAFCRKNFCEGRIFL